MQPGRFPPHFRLSGSQFPTCTRLKWEKKGLVRMFWKARCKETDVLTRLLLLRTDKSTVFCRRLHGSLTERSTGAKVHLSCSDKTPNSVCLSYRSDEVCCVIWSALAPCRWRSQVEYFSCVSLNKQGQQNQTFRWSCWEMFAEGFEAVKVLPLLELFSLFDQIQDRVIILCR